MTLVFLLCEIRLKLFYFSCLLQFPVSSTSPLHPGCCCHPTTPRSTATTCTACGWSSPTLRAESIWPSTTSAWRNNLISSPSRMEERYCWGRRLLSSITLKARWCVLSKQPSPASLNPRLVYSLGCASTRWLFLSPIYDTVGLCVSSGWITDPRHLFWRRPASFHNDQRPRRPTGVPDGPHLHRQRLQHHLHKWAAHASLGGIK